jgi:hypothetical protein
MKLNNRFDPVRSPRTTPRTIWKSPRMKVWINRDVIAETLGRSKERVELDLLNRAFLRGTLFARADGCKHLVVAKSGEALRDPWHPLQDSKVGGIVDDLQNVPELDHNCFDCGGAVR